MLLHKKVKISTYKFRYRSTKYKLDFQLEQGAKIIASTKLPPNDDAAF